MEDSCSVFLWENAPHIAMQKVRRERKNLPLDTTMAISEMLGLRLMEAEQAEMYVCEAHE